MGDYHTELSGKLKIISNNSNNNYKDNLWKKNGISFVDYDNGKLGICFNKKRGHLQDYYIDLKNLTQELLENGISLKGKLTLSLPEYDENNYNYKSYIDINGHNYDILNEYCVINENKLNLFKYPKKELKCSSTYISDGKLCSMNF